MNDSSTKKKLNFNFFSLRKTSNQRALTPEPTKSHFRNIKEIPIEELNGKSKSRPPSRREKAYQSNHLSQSYKEVPKLHILDESSRSKSDEIHFSRGSSEGDPKNSSPKSDGIDELFGSQELYKISKIENAETLSKSDPTQSSSKTSKLEVSPKLSTSSRSAEEKNPKEQRKLLRNSSSSKEEHPKLVKLPSDDDNTIRTSIDKERKERKRGKSKGEDLDPNLISDMEQELRILEERNQKAIQLRSLIAPWKYYYQSQIFLYETQFLRAELVVNELEERADRLHLEVIESRNRISELETEAHEIEAWLGLIKNQLHTALDMSRKREEN